MTVTEIENKYDMGSLWFTDFAGTPERCWFAAGNINGFFEANLITGKAVFLGRFSGEDMKRKMLYTACTKYQNKILFAPALADAIAIYDTETRELKEIPVPDCLKCRDVTFLSIVQYDHLCFLVGSIKPVIACVDLKKDDITYDFQILVSGMEKDPLVAEGYFWDQDIIRKEHFFILTSHRLGICVEYDVTERKARQFGFLPEKGEGGIIAEEHGRYVFSRGRSIICGLKSGEQKEFVPDKEVSARFSQYTCSCLKQDICFVFTDANVIFKIDLLKETMEWVEVEEYAQDFIIEGKLRAFFRCIRVVADRIYLLQAKGNLLKTYDFSLNKIDCKRIMPENKSMFEICRDKYYKDAIFREMKNSPYLNIGVFIENVVGSFRHGDASGQECAGFRIFDAIRNEV